MVDPFTQWAMFPLHKFLFRILRAVPMDGTFNQLRPLNRVPYLTCPLYSLDLSSATDRLPLKLQCQLLVALLGDNQFVDNWATLMVGRSYAVPKHAKSPLKEVRYAVGQPMGALSS
jgi:hypothetical protein